MQQTNAISTPVPDAVPSRLRRFACMMYEAVLLFGVIFLASYLFDTLKYRRCEWKCHSLNEPSKLAAQRFGFHYEGMFRQAIINKGHNRDTCWYSVLDYEWPASKAAFERWLSADNFTPEGQQKQRLETLRG